MIRAREQTSDGAREQTTMPAVPFPPPVPSLSATPAFACAGAAALIGVALLVWGRLAHRGFLVLLAAGLGLLAGRWAAGVIHVHVLLAELVVAVSFGLLAVVLARLVWAILLGGVGAVVAAGVVALHRLPADAAPATRQAATADFGAYLETLTEALHEWAVSAWAADGVTLTVAACLAGMALLVAGFCLPRVAAVFMSCLVGTLLLAGASALVAAQVREAWWTAAWQNPRPCAAAAGGVMLLGMLVQAVGAVRAGKAKKPPAEPKPKNAGSGDS